MKFEFAYKAPLVVVEARLNSKGPFKFVVDTASSATVVGREAAEALGIHQDSNTATGGCCSSKAVAVGLLQMDGMSKSKVPIALGNLSRLCEETGTRLDGILGSPFMQDYEVVIDYPHKEITFKEPEKERRSATEFRLVGSANFILVGTELDGEGPFDFLVDTGATKTVVAKQIGQTFDLRETSNRRRKALSGFFAGTTMAMSRIRSVQVGKARSTDVEVGVQNLQPLCDAVGVRFDGVLGYTFMKDYRFTINYPERELSFEREETSEIDGNTEEVK